MSEYEKLCLAAKDWVDHRERSRELMLQIMGGFVAYSGIPLEHIRYLRWNGDRECPIYFPPEKDGSMYSAPGAMVFDARDGYWCLGVQVLFERTTMLFSLWVSESDGFANAKLGASGNVIRIDLEQSSQCSGFYRRIVEAIEGAFHAESETSIGFSIESTS